MLPEIVLAEKFRMLKRITDLEIKNESLRMAEISLEIKRANRQILNLKTDILIEKFKINIIFTP